jgi:choline dehydrogenase-like flavoprotein
MFIDAETFDSGVTVHTGIVIVGAGPAGIVLALELAKAKYEVTLIEGGQFRFSESIQKLNDASHFDPQFHAPMSDCTRRQVGGTSNIWGGRCLPYDPVDFDPRPYIPYSDWPVSYSELEKYFQKTCDYCLCGSAEFNVNGIPNLKQKSIIPGLPDEEVLTSTLERWSLPTNFGKEYFQQLKANQHIKLIYGLNCIKIETSEQDSYKVHHLLNKTMSGKVIYVAAQKYVLAGGALNTTRLLLASDQQHPNGIGNHSGLLGKFYMGHLSGDIATVRFTTPPQKTIFGFDRDPDHIYIRRRFSFTRDFLHDKELPNIVAWLGAPKFGDPSHKNGILSSAYVALNMPILKDRLTSTAMRNSAIGEDNKGIFHAHIQNIIRDIGKTLTFLPGFGYERFIARRKVPALFVYSAANEYPLHYHSEQVPNVNSHVSLSTEKDILGMRKLDIKLQFTQQDIDGIVKAHQYWDQHLRKHNCGYLKYLTDDPEARIWDQAGDGFHQVGTTRMSNTANDGVVDTNCKVHGFSNLFIASSSIFVTSGQANSTFMIIAFALRLAGYLKQQKEEICLPKKDIVANRM